MLQYPIDFRRLDTLRATRGGRVALAGFEYQRAFAVLRLAAMVSHRSTAVTDDVPTWLRYEWAEDVDELTAAGDTILWQCKHGDEWTTPARLAEVALGFAPKWLWAPPEAREALAFRLVTSDRACARHHDVPGVPPAAAEVRRAFLAALASPPPARSDRALWQADADAAGHEALFGSIWGALRILYLPGTTERVDGVVVWHAERTAVELLAHARKIADVGRMAEIVAAMRALLGIASPGHADASGMVDRPDEPPRALRPVDVSHRLFGFGPSPDPGILRVVDRFELLQNMAKPPPPPYVARRPEWTDVVRGANTEVRFFERTLTEGITDTVRRALAEAASLQGRLRLQFLVGAPGAGKSTLALRVAAQLVLNEHCVAVDARHTLDPDDDLEGIADAVRRLATGGRPVLMVLDDPFGADSAWPRLMRLLGRAGLPVVVLAATPDFLLYRHEHELRDVERLADVSIDRLDARERRALESLYPGADRLQDEGDQNLLVLAMQAAAGASFDDIVDGIWATLADRRRRPSSALARDLPWEQAAFLAVCYFHRAYAACPVPLLAAVLEGRDDVGGDAVERLGQLVQRQGWRLFQVEDADPKFTYQGGTVRAMHARVAQRAWERRPGKAWDVAARLAQASVGVPQVARPLARGLVALRDHGETDAMAVFLRAWTRADAATIQTRYLCDLATILGTGGVDVAAALGRSLTARAQVLDSESWLAALALHRASTANAAPQAFPADLPLLDIIRVGDFSLGPNRASQLINALDRHPRETAAVFDRLWRAFDGELAWSVGGTLLTLIVARSAPEHVRSRLGAIRAWLRAHPDDTNVRQGFIGLYPLLPTGERASAVEELRTWLRTHPDDANVRQRFIGLLPSLSIGERASAVGELRTWLREHPDDANVRQRFLGLIPSLSVWERAAVVAEVHTWLQAHPDDTRVRQGFVRLLPSLDEPKRSEAIGQFRTWLRTHPDDADVRQGFVRLLPSLDEPERSEAMGELRAWLRTHSDDADVRQGFISLLPALADEERSVVIEELRVWLRAHPDDTNVRTRLLAHLTRNPTDGTDRDRVDALAWLHHHPTDTSVRAVVLTLSAAWRTPDLATLLEDTLARASHHRRFQNVAAAAVKVAANLPAEHAPVVARWLAWAAGLLDAYAGDRAVRGVAESTFFPDAALRRHLADPAVGVDIAREMSRVLATVGRARSRWYASVRLRQPDPFE